MGHYDISDESFVQDDSQTIQSQILIRLRSEDALGLKPNELRCSTLRKDKTIISTCNYPKSFSPVAELYPEFRPCRFHPNLTQSLLCTGLSVPNCLASQAFFEAFQPVNRISI